MKFTVCFSVETADFGALPALAEQIADRLRMVPGFDTVRLDRVATIENDGKGGAVARSIDRTCPRCGHIHEGDAECGVDIGGGRICRCELEVRV